MQARGSLRRGHHSRGGRGGGRVSFAASPHACGAGNRRGRMAGRGERRGDPAGSGRLADGPCLACDCRAMSQYENAGIGERSPAAHRLGSKLVFNCVEFKCENTKHNCVSCNSIAYAPNQKRSPDRSDDRLVCTRKASLSWRRLRARCGLGQQPRARLRQARRCGRRRRTCRQP